MIKVTIDEEACIGCSLCESICEETFEMREDKAIVKKQPEKITCEREAMESCPVEAIKIQSS